VVFYYPAIHVFAYLNMMTSQGVQEADRPAEGFYIRSGIVVVVKNATIEDGTVI